MCRRRTALTLLALAIGFAVGCDTVTTMRTIHSGVPAPTAREEPTGTTRAAAPAGLVGTWRGTLSADNGEPSSATLEVSASGHPVYEYVTRSGPRKVELTAVGQSLRYVPPDGGVFSVTVDALSVSPERVAFTLSLSHEKTSGQTLSQSRATLRYEAALAGAELDVRATLRSQHVVSQPGIPIPGRVRTLSLQGKLKRG